MSFFNDHRELVKRIERLHGIEFAYKVQSAIIDTDEMTPTIRIETEESQFDVDYLQNALKNAKRPVFLVGGGIILIYGIKF